LWEHFKEKFIGLVTSRIFFVMIFSAVLMIVLLHRIFLLQIVNGASYQENFSLKIKKEKVLTGARGKIYDRNGELLAYNELTYNVTIEDVYASGRSKNINLNSTIKKLIELVEKNGDSCISDFNIIIGKDGNFEYSVEGTARLRFIADVYGVKSTDELKYELKTQTAEELMDYLQSRDKYGIGEFSDINDKNSFIPGKGFTKEEILKVATIRYALSANSYQKYIATTCAYNVSPKTVAIILENSKELEGVSIAEDTIRKYVDSVYFSHIMGYTGKISPDELVELQLENPDYNANDMIGKAGIEQVMETSLQGKKGSETLFVDNLGKVIETQDRVEPVAGNDLYLTIDKNLQKAVYRILEQKIAGILISKIDNIRSYNYDESTSASDIRIAITDVYYALFNNNVIDLKHIEKSTAGDTEKEVLEVFNNRKEKVLSSLENELKNGNTAYQDLPEDMKVYESFIVSMLSSERYNIIDSSKVNTNDTTVHAWKELETISISEYLKYCISQNWVEISELDLSDRYSSGDEIYEALINKTFELLDGNTDFYKKIYKYMLLDEEVTGKQVCQILLEQGIVDVSDKDETDLKNGNLDAYHFMLNLIQDLDITPANLALDPCQGSCVVTDVNTGEVLALVTYPGYDTNRLANNIDAAYYAQLQKDLSKPMWNYATQQRSAPGSTFKMVSATAGMEEGVISQGEYVTCTGTYDKLDDKPPRCWLHSGHGSLNIIGGIQNSCNYFFYEIGYRLGSQGTGLYNSDRGLEKLNKYADMYGLSETSGIEIQESTPGLSDMDAVRSAIGQGTYNFTTVGLARYVTAVANSGTVFKLSLLDKLTDTNGNLLVDYTPEIRNHVQLSASEWNAIHSGMRLVVQGKKYFNDLNVQAAGKTGTAQESKLRANHALFVGYAPYNNPEISIATRVAFGYSSDYAAQISRDVLKYYFDRDSAEEILTGFAMRPDAIEAAGD